MTHSNRNLGARRIDYLLLEKFCAEFNQKYNCNPITNGRCRIRMLDAIEKMRKLLTANKETEINVESLMEDEDFQKKFTREDL